MMSELSVYMDNTTIVSRGNVHLLYSSKIPHILAMIVSENLLADFNITNICMMPLICLNISSNRLIIPMTKITRMTTLQILNLSNVGKIAFEGIDFTPLVNLHTLDISCNQLVRIPEGLHAVVELDLSVNSIVDFSPLKKYTRLRNVDISENPTDQIDIVGKLSMLRI